MTQLILSLSLCLCFVGEWAYTIFHVVNNVHSLDFSIYIFEKFHNKTETVHSPAFVEWNMQKLTHARHAPSTQTSLIPLLNPNVLRLSPIVHQHRVDKTSEWKTIINFFASLLCHSTNEALFLFVSPRIRHRSKHTHVLLILVIKIIQLWTDELSELHTIVYIRDSMLVLSTRTMSAIVQTLMDRMKCKRVLCWMRSVNRSPASPPTVAVELSRRTNPFYQHRLAARVLSSRPRLKNLRTPSE